MYMMGVPHLVDGVSTDGCFCLSPKRIGSLPTCVCADVASDAGKGMLTLVCHFKKVMHRRWSYFKTRVGFTMALVNLLVQYGLSIDDDGFVPLSIAQFSL